ncbi:MAG TPA: hypothetical protein VF549_17120 [Solirubrobacteraceae bacterium]|jgi:hypothetical protein
MPRRRGALIAILLAPCAGCADVETAPLAPACTDGPQHVERALRAAPRAVRLADGTPLSDCVGHAITDSDLQNVGLVFTEAAEELEGRAPREPRAALQLGYLIGAARRGAPGDSSIQAELVHRLERSAAVDMPPAAEDALAEGMRAGERGG